MQVAWVRSSGWSLFWPAFFCSILWGSAFPAIKSVYAIWEQAGIKCGLTDYWAFAGVRFTLAGIALLLCAKNPQEELKRTPIRPLLALTATQTMGQYLLFYLGLAVSSGSLGALVTASGSFWWVLLAPMFFHAPWPRRSQWIALIVGGLGVGLAVAKPGAGGSNPWLGGLLLTFAALCGSLGMLIFPKVRTTMGARAATGYSLLWGGLVLLACAFPAWNHWGRYASWPVLGWLLWLVFTSAAAFSWWNHLTTKHPVPLLASYRFLVPVCGVIESLLLLPGESAGMGLWFGGALVVGSLIAIQRPPREKAGV